MKILLKKSFQGILPDKISDIIKNESIIINEQIIAAVEQAEDASYEGTDMGKKELAEKNPDKLFKSNIEGYYFGWSWEYNDIAYIQIMELDPDKKYVLSSHNGIQSALEVKALEVPNLPKDWIMVTV